MQGHLLLTNRIEDEVRTLLREVFKIHPLAVEDVKEFHQRPKIEDYDDFVSIVAYGTGGWWRCTGCSTRWWTATATCSAARWRRTCRWCPTGSTT